MDTTTPTERRRPVTLRLEPEVWKAIRIKAATDGKTLSETVNEVMERGLLLSADGNGREVAVT